MSEQPTNPNSNSGLNTFPDKERLAGCLQLRADPEFDLTYFDLVNSGMLDPRTSGELPDTPEEAGEDRRLTIDQASAILGMSPPFLRKLMQEGSMPHHEFELQKQLMLSDVEAYLRKRIEVTEDFNRGQ